MAPTLSLRRPRPPRALISLVPMIDVMLILLVFFMVTSTYLNLDMIPAVTRGDARAEAPQPAAAGAAAPALLIRLGADGVPSVRGRSLDPASLAVLLRERLSTDPMAQVLVLPSGAASMQALTTVMETATSAGVVRLQVVRLEKRP